MDGFIPAEALPQLGFDFDWLGTPERLVEAGLFEQRNDGGYWVHDYLECNPSKREVETKRRNNRRRSRESRERHAVTNA